MNSKRSFLPPAGVSKSTANAPIDIKDGNKVPSRFDRTPNANKKGCIHVGTDLSSPNGIAGCVGLC